MCSDSSNKKECFLCIICVCVCGGCGKKRVREEKKRKGAVTTRHPPPTLKQTLAPGRVSRKKSQKKIYGLLLLTGRHPLLREGGESLPTTKNWTNSPPVEAIRLSFFGKFSCKKITIRHRSFSVDKITLTTQKHIAAHRKNTHNTYAHTPYAQAHTNVHRESHTHTHTHTHVYV